MPYTSKDHKTAILRDTTAFPLRYLAYKNPPFLIPTILMLVCVIFRAIWHSCRKRGYMQGLKPHPLGWGIGSLDFPVPAFFNPSYYPLPGRSRQQSDCLFCRVPDFPPSLLQVFTHPAPPPSPYAHIHFASSPINHLHFCLAVYSNHNEMFSYISLSPPP